MAKKELSFQERKKLKLKQITKDYQIANLTSSDEENLDKLASAYVILEDLEDQINTILDLMKEDPTNKDLTISLQNLSSSASKLRSDISKIQNDLGITRRQREQESGEDVVNHIRKIKKAARLFAKYRTTLVFCDECNILLGQIWFAFPDTKGNTSKFVCPKCNKAVNYSPVPAPKPVHPSNYKKVPQYM